MKKFEIPAKTFLLGEYAVLENGKALIALTTPSFVLEVGGEQAMFPFHPASPAGKLFQVLPAQKRQNIRWSNPWKDQGGFGASSAEFVGMFLAHESTVTDPVELSWHAWKIFRLMTAQMKNRPSGADVLAQAWGTATSLQNPALLALDLSEKTIASTNSSLGLTLELFHTGEKLPTHEHLAQDLPPFPLDEANELVSMAVGALSENKSDDFVEAVSGYGALLARSGRLAPHSERLLKAALAKEGVLAAKGCGAMGSDVIAVVSKNGSGLPNSVSRWRI